MNEERDREGVGGELRDFFISYTGADAGWAEWIAWQLEDAGYTTVIAAWDFHAGNDFVGEMHSAARIATRTIAVVSRAYLAAEFTQPEWTAAFVQDPTGEKRTLLPVRVADCQADGILRSRVYVDLVGLDEQAARLKLLASARAQAQRNKPARAPNFPGPGQRPPAPGFPGLPPAFSDLRAALLGGDALAELSEATLQAILRHSPGSLDEYRLARIAEWSQSRYALDKRFTRLTVLVDQGPEAQGTRWQAQPQTFDDLRRLLAETSDTALVLLGPPGCGKSTLLRRLELDLGRDALRAKAGEKALCSFFVPLSRYRPAGAGETLPTPQAWLAREWSRQSPQLPAIDELLASGRLLLLLDAVNEIPHRDEADYRERIGHWRDFLAELARSAPGTRAIFSCRSLDYSAPLSTPDLTVPHVRIEALADAKVEAFLTLHSAEHGPALWSQLRGTPQLDLFRSPFYLKLLLAQAGSGGPLLQGRAGLFTGFVREVLRREIEARNPLFVPGALLDHRDYDRVVQRRWGNPFDLPARGPLLPALSQLAHVLQARRAPGEASRVRVPYDDVLALLGDDQPEHLLRAGVALQVLEVQADDVLYVHQLLQEYFAARLLAARPQPELVASEWRADAISPSLSEVLDGLAVADPLPEAPTSGWEQTCLLAAAMTPASEVFVTALMAVNLPLAGHCAAQPEVLITSPLRRRLQQALIERSRDPAADLRARIAAARSLGEIGDPRFVLLRGEHGDYLLPPVVAIAAAAYPIDSDEGGYPDEAPAHVLPVGAFRIGQFPVTNAEWRLFMTADGYDDERWWASEAAQRWRRGEGTAEGPKQRLREARQWILANPDEYQRLVDDGRVTAVAAANWAARLAMSDADFEEWLAGEFPGGRQSAPARWNDPAFNGAAQPVVGICWHEARAYCAWLSARTGQIWRLPSEVEWEAAARGRTRRRYAWGEDFDVWRCNTFATHVRGTTPVGVFPAGDTPEGVVDLSGNVWEWTSSAYRPYRDVADSLREDPALAGARVLRGGSWLNDPGSARGSSRLTAHPDDRSDHLGFRVVSSAPIT